MTTRQIGSILALVAIAAAIPLVRSYKAAHASLTAEAVDVDEGTAADRAAKRAALARDAAGLTAKRVAHGADVGGMELTFTARSPLSTPALLAARLRLATPPVDYNLASVGFFAYVPPAYDPARPMGLIVLANYKPTTGLPDSIFAQLDAANVAFVVAKPLAQPWTTRAGLLLDAAHNMGIRYRIDPRRVYLIASNEPKDPDGIYRLTGQQVGLSFPDVFTGTIAVTFGMYRPVRAANGGSWRATLLPNSPDLLARQRPLVLASMEPNDAEAAFAAAFTADGFRHVRYRTLTVEQFHYPHYTSDWLPETLKFMDDVNLASPATTRAMP